MNKPLLLAAAVLAAAAAAARRREARSNTETLWREATADASR